MSASTLVARDPGLDPARVPVLDPDAPLRPTRGWRLPLRLARRDAARHPWRTALGMLMVGLPVFVALTAAFVLRTDSIDAYEVGPYAFGQADGLVADMREPDWGFWSQPDGFRYGLSIEGGLVPPGDERTSEEIADLVGSRVVPLTRGSTEMMGPDGSTVRVTATEYDPAEPVTEGLAIIDEGRLPRGADEVTVSPDLAARANIGTGDEIVVAERQLTVTGIATVPVGLGAQQGLQVVGLPGGLSLDTDRSSTGYLVTGDLPGVDDPALDTAEFRASQYGSSDWEAASLQYFVDTFAEQDDLNLVSRALLEDLNGSGGLNWFGVAGWQGALSPFLAPVYALVVIQLAVMSAPALAVGVRQSRRMFALLQGAGADGRALRRTVLAQAGVIGLVGSGLAALLAVLLVGGVVLAGWWPDQLGVRGPLEIRAGDVILAVLVATGAVVLAGVLPARRVAASSPVGSLAGRAASHGVPWRRAVWGAVVVVASLLMVWALGSAGSIFFFGPLAVLGLVVGMLLLVPLIVVGLGRVADRLPLSGYLAMRDAARASGRSVAAVATVAIAVAGAVSASMTLASLQAFDRATYVPQWPDGTTIIALGGPADESGQAYEDVASAAAAAVEEALPEASATPIAMQRYDSEVTVADDYVEAVVIDADTVPALGYRVDDEALRAMESGAVLLVPAGPGDIDRGDVRVDRGGDVTESTAAVVNIRGRVSQSSPEALMIPATADRLGIPLIPTRVLVEVPGTLTTAQEDELEAAMEQAAPGSSVYTERGYRGSSGLTTAIHLLVLAAIVVVVLGTLTATALAIIDTRRERDLLAAAGASPRTGRGVGAATAIGYAGTGAVVGTVLGVLLGLVFALRTVPGARGASTADPVVVLPWIEIAVLVIVLPLTLGVVTWLVARGGSALAGAREASRV